MAYDWLGWVATAVTGGLFVSNSVQIKRVDRARSTAGQSAAVLLGTLLNCEWWTMYGMLTINAAVIACNAVGLAIAIWGLAVFIKWSPAADRQRLSTATAAIAVGSVVALVLMHYAAGHEAAVKIAGSVASTASVLLFVSPMIGLRDVVARGDSSALSPVVVGFFVAASSLWSLYAALIGDAFMLLPNAIGLALSLVQLGVFLRYRRVPPSIAHPGGVPTMPATPTTLPR